MSIKYECAVISKAVDAISGSGIEDRKSLIKIKNNVDEANFKAFLSKCTPVHFSMDFFYGRYYVRLYMNVCMSVWISKVYIYTVSISTRFVLYM